MKIFIRIIYSVVAVFRFSKTEARVYCGDPNSNNLTYMGYSCPLKCANVIAVVEQLKVFDYHRLLEEDSENILGTYGRSLGLSPQNDAQNGTKSYQNNTRRLNKILTNKKIITFLKKELKYYSALNENIRANCNKVRRSNALNSSKTNFEKGSYEQCIRRSSYEHDFVRKLTRFLNGYAKSNFKFTKSMVVLLLRKILGTNIDLRQGELVLPQIIKFLRIAMERTLHEPAIIHVAPRHCLGIFVPGCFCKDGFLEKDGRCVSLMNCLQEGNKDLSNYANRIILHKK